MHWQIASLSDDPKRLREEAWVCEQNINQFRKRLSQESDPRQRRLLTELIARETNRLMEINAVEAIDPSPFRPTESER